STRDVHQLADLTRRARIAGAARVGVVVCLPASAVPTEVGAIQRWITRRRADATAAVRRRRANVPIAAAVVHVDRVIRTAETTQRLARWTIAASAVGAVLADRACVAAAAAVQDAQ